MKWTLDDALKLIRALQPESRRFGYHLCLGGGVLNKGESEKDLDLYFIQLNRSNNPPKPDDLVSWLTNLWGQPEEIMGYEPEDNPAVEQPQYGFFRYGENIPIVPAARNLHPQQEAYYYRLLFNGAEAGPQNNQPPVIPRPGLVAQAEPPALPAGPYTKKLKFFRGEDRIDVFVI